MLIWTLLACIGDELAVADHALAFDGAGCVDVPVDDALSTDELTIEGWVRASVDAGVGHKPVVVWPGVFALTETEDGRFWFGDDALSAGTYDIDGVMDGSLHHVAGVWSGGSVTVYVDGASRGFASAERGELGDALQIGCWRDEDAWFEGVIDEVRLSPVVRYDDDFEIEAVPFVLDEDTSALWHMDEQEGSTVWDAAGSYHGEASGVEWIDSPLD